MSNYNDSYILWKAFLDKTPPSWMSEGRAGVVTPHDSLMDETCCLGEVFLLALDTIGLRSPYLPEEVALRVERECVLKQGLDMRTGELLYSITTSQLEGSYDSRISVRVLREEWTSSITGNPIKRPCKPYLYVEASVHKAMAGHNVYGGPDNFQLSSAFLVGLVQNLLEVELPYFGSWLVKRIDSAECYELPSAAAVEEWFRALNLSTFPRRQVDRYGLSGIYVKGATTTLKFYHKGPEFRKHDFSRLKRVFSSEKLFTLLERANQIIRCELEIKPAKLKYDFGHLPTVAEVTDAYIEKTHDADVERFLKEVKSDVMVVRDAHAVERRLNEVYDHRLAGILLGTWYRLSTMGEDYVRKSMPKPTFYRHRKLLVEAGVSWLGTDVVLRDYSLIPEGFVPVRRDSRRIVEILPEVRDKLQTVSSMCKANTA